MQDNTPESTSTSDPASPKGSLIWLLLPLALVTLARSGQDSPAVGKPGPQIDLVQLTSDSYPQPRPVQRLGSGEVTLIHFWGTWCGPCKLEYPELAEMVTRLERSRGFRFLSVSCEADPSETYEGLTEKTMDYFATAGIEGAAYADPTGVTRRSAAERLEQSSLYYPTSILVGPEGKIAGVWSGYTPGSVEQMERVIETLRGRTN